MTSKNIIDGKIDLSTCYKISEQDFELVNRRSQVNENDVIIAMIGVFVGEVALIQSFQNDFCIKNVGLFKNDNLEKGRWLFFWVQSNHIQNYIKANLGGSAQKFVSLSQLRNLPIVELEKSERDLIIKTFDVLNQKIEVAEERLLNYQAIFKALLHELMSGVRRIKDNEIYGK